MRGPRNEGARDSGLGSHRSLSTSGAFPELRVLDQGFQDGQALVRFELPLGQEMDLEARWRERSRGGTITWEL